MPPFKAQRVRAAAPLFAVLVIVIAGLLAWSGSLEAPFIFDDHNDIEEDPAIRHLRPLSSILIHTPRPVVRLSFALDYARSGLLPRPFHATNLAIHLLAGLVLFGLVRQSLRLPKLGERFGAASTGLALATALLWTLHPLHSSTIAYTVHRYESMMGLFYLATLWAFVRSIGSERPGRWLAASVAFCLLGTGSKEVMASAPLVVLLYDRCFVSDSFRRALRDRSLYWIGLFTAWPLLLLLKLTSPRIPSVGFGNPSLSAWDYLRTEAGVILHYLRLAAWPSGLVIDYYDWPIARTVPQWLPQGLVVVALLALAAVALVRWPPAGFAAASLFLILSPTSTILPYSGEVAAERRMYLPLAAPLAIAVCGGWALLSTRRPSGPWRTRGAAACVMVAAIALGIAARHRTADFRSERTILEDNIEKRPRNARARNNLGGALMAEGESERAEAEFLRAIELAPDLADARHNLGLSLEKRGRFAEAIENYRRAVAMEPGDAAFANDLAWILVTAPAPFRQPAEALVLARHACDVASPPRAETWDTLSSALAANNQPTEAAEALARAIVLAREAGNGELARELEAKLAGSGS